MRKKTWIWLLLTAVAVVLVLGVTGFVQFKGRAVTEQAELFVGSHATYEEVVDSLMPRMRHRAAFTAMPGGSICPRPSRRAIISSSPA